MVIVALFPVGKMWKQSKCSLVDKQIKIMYILYIYIYIYISYTHAHNGMFWSLKIRVLSYATSRMGLDDIMLSEVNRSKKDKYCKIPLLRGIWINQIHGNRKYNRGCKGLWGGRIGELFLNRCRASGMQDEKVLQICSRAMCTQLATGYHPFIN